MTRFLGLLLVTATLSLGSCQCSNKPDVGPVEEAESARLNGTDAIEMNRSADVVPAASLPVSIVSISAIS